MRGSAHDSHRLHLLQIPEAIISNAWRSGTEKSHKRLHLLTKTEVMGSDNSHTMDVTTVSQVPLDTAVFSNPA